MPDPIAQPADNEPMTPFLGGDPIVDEDLGSVDDLHAELGEPAPKDPDPDETDLPFSDASAVEEAPIVEEPAAVVPQPDPEPVVEPPAAPAPKRIMIPKERFDQVSERARAAERRLQEMERQFTGKVDGRGQVLVNVNPGEKLKQHAKLILDGKEDEAAALMADILVETSNSSARAAVEQIRGTVESINVETAMDSLITEIESSIPQLDPQNQDSYDEELVSEVLALQRTYATRMSPVKAMEKALVVAMRTERPELYSHYFESEQEEVEVIETPRIPATPGVRPQQPVAPSKPATPQPSAIKKNIAAAAAQPPVAPVAGNATEKPLPKITEMSEEEFEALPESVRRKMRGDNL